MYASGSGPACHAAARLSPAGTTCGAAPRPPFGPQPCCLKPGGQARAAAARQGFSGLSGGVRGRGARRTASSSDQAPTGMRSCACECAKKHTRRAQRSPSMHSCVRYLDGCRLRSYTPCAYGHWFPCAARLSAASAPRATRTVERHKALLLGCFPHARPRSLKRAWGHEAGAPCSTQRPS